MTKAAPMTYGICLTEQFRATEHNYKDIFTDPEARRVIPGGLMSWLIKKGDLIMANERLIAEKEMLYTFSEGKGDTLTLPIYVCDRAHDLPKRFKQVARGTSFHLIQDSTQD
jgi:hypothetical protein